MGFQQWTERNSGGIAIFTAVIALLVAIGAYWRPLPDQECMTRCIWEGCLPETPAVVPADPSPEFLAKLEERIALLNGELERLQNDLRAGRAVDPEELYTLQLERDLALLYRHGVQKGRGGQWNAAATLLNARWHRAVAKLRDAAHKAGAISDAAWCRARLAANAAELEWLDAWHRLTRRGAARPPLQALENYPAEPVDEETLFLIYDLGTPDEVPAPAPAAPAPAGKTAGKSAPAKAAPPPAPVPAPKQ